MLSNMGGEQQWRLARETVEDFRDRRLSPDSMAVAKELLRYWAKDAEARIRRLIAEQLRNDPELPIEVAQRLARDISDISIPLIKNYPRFSDEDLLDILQHTEELTVALAMADRPHVSERVGLALVERGQSRLVEALANNPGAAITQNMLISVARHYGDQGDLIMALMERTTVSASLVDRIVLEVTDQVKRAIIRRYHVSPFKMHKTASIAREWSIGILLDAARQHQIPEFVDYLQSERKLSDSLIMRGLCMGNLYFFECVLAKRAGIPLANTRRLLHDPGERGFEAIYTAAKLPEHLYAPTWEVMQLVKDEAAAAKREGRIFSTHNLLRAIIDRRLDHDVPHLNVFVQLLRTAGEMME